MIKIDVWLIPGLGGPTLYPHDFWTHFGSLLEIRFGTHFFTILEAVSGDSFWSWFGASKVSRRVARRYTLKHTLQKVRT